MQLAPHFGESAPQEGVAEMGKGAAIGCALSTLFEKAIPFH